MVMMDMDAEVMLGKERRAMVLMMPWKAAAGTSVT